MLVSKAVGVLIDYAVGANKKNGFSVYEDLWTGSCTHTLLPNKTQKVNDA